MIHEDFPADLYEQFIALAELIESLNQEKETIAEAAEAWDEWTKTAEEDEDLIAHRKDSCPTRPPRYVGPVNRTVMRVQRLARVARSSCRKIHR